MSCKILYSNLDFLFDVIHTSIEEKIALHKIVMSLPNTYSMHYFLYQIRSIFGEWRELENTLWFWFTPLV
jgi:hypothetical protein